MKATFTVQGYSQSAKLHDHALRPHEILKLLRICEPESNLSLDLSQAFEICEFQLGDQILKYDTATQVGNSVYQEQKEGDFFYVVGQGRVRLLGVDTIARREVSALMLEAGESFGAETLLCNISCLTRAIAASDTQVARISLSKLQTWLEQLPQLREHLLQEYSKRQCLIFFKTSTDLRSLSNYQLRQLLPYLVETRVASEEALVQSTPSDSGRFWLCSGQIQSRGAQVSVPTEGGSWGYPNPTPADWTAQTDLLVYKLPREHWEEAQVIAPALLPTSVDIASVNGRQVSPKTAISHQPSAVSNQNSVKAAFVVNSSARTTSLSANAPASKTQNLEPEPVTFPKPMKRSRRFWQGYPFIEQQSSSDCGAACLAMLGRYWGKQFSLNFLRNLAGVGRSGASLTSLATAAESLGFQARPVRASLSRLVEQSHPWIAHWQGDHYVVVYRVKGNNIVIADPAMGKRSLSRQQFIASWTGYALLLEPTELLQATQEQKTSLNSFWSLLWPYRSLVVQIILASLLIQVFGLITPLFTQVILDRVVVQKSLLTLHIFALGLLLFGFGRICLTAIRQYLLDYFANRLDLTLISGFISHTLTLPLKFFESRHVGDIITRVQENQKIQRFLTRQAVIAWLDASMAVVYLGLMAYYNWHLTLLVLALIPPIAILTFCASPLLRRVSRQIFNEEAGQNSSLVEMMTGVATVKAAAAERELRWRWEDRLTSMLNAQFRGQKLANGLQAISGLINTLGSTALLWYGANLVIQDQLTIGQFVAFNMMIGNVINPVLSLVNLWDQLQEVMVSVERLNDVFSAQPEESPGKQLLKLPRLQGDVKFENVTFRYGEQEERNTLQNIDFEVQSGQTIAIVGRSGSGKSTLVNLVQGFYHPSSGRILVDGHDICHVSPHSLRSQLGVVPQECFLFSGTILENITLYSNEFTLEQVIEVAKLAEAHAFIQDLPLGYQTKVGERGSKLSGGQRQRIAIARALLGNPRILILDEATSSLDTESERRFQQNLAHISRVSAAAPEERRTTFIIAHRLSTVRYADCILVLDRGILVERGTHEQLISLQGLYYHLAQQQLDL